MLKFWVATYLRVHPFRSQGRSDLNSYTCLASGFSPVDWASITGIVTARKSSLGIKKYYYKERSLKSRDRTVYGVGTLP